MVEIIVSNYMFLNTIKSMRYLKSKTNATFYLKIQNDDIFGANNVVLGIPMSFLGNISI